MFERIINRAVQAALESERIKRAPASAFFAGVVSTAIPAIVGLVGLAKKDEARENHIRGDVEELRVRLMEADKKQRELREELTALQDATSCRRQTAQLLAKQILEGQQRRKEEKKLARILTRIEDMTLASDREDTDDASNGATAKGTYRSADRR